MKYKKPNAAQLWKQFEDLAPLIRLSAGDRTVYSYLLRHSRLEGRRRLEFSLRELARGVGVSPSAVRFAVRRLITRGVLLLVKRSRTGHVVEVRSPEEILAVKAGQLPPRHRRSPRTSDLEELDFLNHPARRRVIHARERGRCFYCLGHLTVHTRCLDHVVSRVELEDNSYRNLVSCCKECNSHKSDLPAPDFLCGLHRERRLTSAQLTGRLRAVDALVLGKLRPTLPNLGHTGNHN